MPLKDRAAYNAYRRKWRAANPDLYRSACKRQAVSPVSGASRREWYSANRKDLVAQSVEWGKNNRARRLEIVRKYKYGITAQQYEELFVFQGDVCWICQESGELHVDHDHATGQVRGLLCRTCNTGFIAAIERKGFNLEAMQRALDYLKNPPFTS